MTRPSRFLIRMVLFLIAVAVVGVLLFAPLQSAFMANAPLNGLIVGVLVLGITYNFRQVITLYPEVDWIDTFRSRLDNSGLDFSADVLPQAAPKLLAPRAPMLGDRQHGFSLSTLSMRSLLDGILSRLDESRDLSRYTIGLLIFLGLLGTFWGLLETVGSIGNVISGLSIGSGENPGAMFETLKQGLEAPMSGMGTAFSSSLFGLAGSLVLGFLDLQANQAQNRFYNQLEEWLSSVTRLSSGALGAETDHSVPAYVQALLEQTAESLENLQRTLARGEESRINLDSHIISVSEKLEVLTDHMRTEQAVMVHLAETQMDLRPLLAKIAERPQDHGGMGLDDATRAHIRNMDLLLARMAEDLSGGREEMMQQLKSEVRMLARTISLGSQQGSNGSDG